MFFLNFLKTFRSYDINRNGMLGKLLSVEWIWHHTLQGPVNSNHANTSNIAVTKNLKHHPSFEKFPGRQPSSLGEFLVCRSILKSFICFMPGRGGRSAAAPATSGPPPQGQEKHHFCDPPVLVQGLPSSHAQGWPRDLLVLPWGSNAFPLGVAPNRSWSITLPFQIFWNFYCVFS